MTSVSAVARRPFARSLTVARLANRGTPSRPLRELRKKPAGRHAGGCFALCRSEVPMTEQRKEHRILLERGHPTQMMAIDGTWRRDCMMEDVSEGGAKLTVEGSVEGLHLKEFFLLLSSTGLAYRRCELAWVNGDQLGVIFLERNDRKRNTPTRKPA
jgi:hypothetical protein